LALYKYHLNRCACHANPQEKGIIFISQSRRRRLGSCFIDLWAGSVP